jgi:hypothetical protein
VLKTLRCGMLCTMRSRCEGLLTGNCFDGPCGPAKCRPRSLGRQPGRHAISKPCRCRRLALCRMSCYVLHLLCRHMPILARQPHKLLPLSSELALMLVVLGKAAVLLR